MSVSHPTHDVADRSIIGAGWISSMFAKDLALDRPEVTDVLHSVAAVGARDKDRAQKFIEEFLPNGATAQQAGLRPPPVACQGYAELYAREVSGRGRSLLSADPRTSTSSTSAPSTPRTTQTSRRLLRPASTSSSRNPPRSTRPSGLISSASRPRRSSS